MEKAYDDSTSKHVKTMQQPLVDALQERFNPPSSGPYPFNLSRALAGAALVTRDGREATNFRRIKDASYPCAADAENTVETYTGTGHIWASEKDHRLDLFMRDPDPSAPPVPVIQTKAEMPAPDADGGCWAAFEAWMKRPADAGEIDKGIVPAAFKAGAKWARKEAEETSNRLRKGIQWAMDGAGEQTTEKSLANVLRRLRIVLADRKVHTAASPPAEGGE